MKTIRGLKYADFLQVMRRQLYIPYKLSAIVFTRLCKPRPNEKNPIVAKIFEMQKEIDISRDTNVCHDSVIQIDEESHILLSHAARVAFSQSVLYWTDLLSFAQAQSISQERKSDFQLTVEPTP